jgi:hypothetical protein
MKRIYREILAVILGLVCAFITDPIIAVIRFIWTKFNDRRKDWLFTWRVSDRLNKKNRA